MHVHVCTVKLKSTWTISPLYLRRGVFPPEYIIIKELHTVYLLIYRTLLITPDDLLGNFRCSNTTDTPVL